MDLIKLNEKLGELLEEMTKLRDAVAKMVAVKPEDCHGCSDDVYNGQLAEKCWGLTSGKLRPTMLVPNDAAPPWNFPVQMRPSCYKCKGYSNISADVAKETNEKVRRRGC